ANLPQPGEEIWYQVAYQGPTTTPYHPRVTLTVNPGNEFVIDVMSNCSGGQIACGMEGGNAVNRTDWEQLASGGDATGNAYSPTPAVGTGGTVWVRVHRANSVTSCSSFTVQFSN